MLTIRPFEIFVLAKCRDVHSQVACVSSAYGANCRGAEWGP